MRRLPLRKVLFWLAILLAVIPGTSRATTLAASDVLARARVYLRDQSTAANRQQFPDSTLLQFLSDGQREANAQNWLIQSSFTFNLTAATTEYAMPQDFMFPNRVWYQQPGQPYTKLPASSMNDLDARTPGWLNVPGTPISYYMDLSSQTMYMGFYPAPTSSNLGPVVVYYVQSPADLTSTNEGAIPFNGWYGMQPYASALPYYMAYRAYLTLEETELAGEYLKMQGW